LRKGDPRKLRQVFANLIGNAVKFTAAGGTVFVDTQSESDGAVVVLVRDTGVGMDAEEIAVALAPFGQVDGTRTRWREGTGLGLPIAKALVELHGGRLAIKSVKSVGTEVRVELPSPVLVSFMQQDMGIQSARA
jgi:two-component system cell cycle sensor histidine kinase PleC